jgi:twitching motility protein PilJ
MGLKEDVIFNGDDSSLAKVAAVALTKALAGRLRLPLLSKYPLQKQVRILLVGLVASLLLAGIFVSLNLMFSSLASTQTQIAGDALMHSQRIGKAAPNAIQGNGEAFKQLEESRKEFNRNLAMLFKGGTSYGIDVYRPSAKAEALLKDSKKIWDRSDKAAETVLALKVELTGFGATLQKLNAISPVLLDLTEQIGTLKMQGGATPRETSAASQLSMLTQRLARSANEFLSADGANPETAFLLGKDVNTFRDIIDGFLQGSELLRLSPVQDTEVRARLLKLKLVFNEYRQLVSGILGNMPKFVAAKQSEQLIFNENELLKQKLSLVQQTYRSEQDTTHWTFWLMLLCVAGALTAAAGIALTLLEESSQRARDAELQRNEAEVQRLLSQQQEADAKAENEKTQKAILRLMNELQEVADGDLTVQATVSEDITGAIADSVNYTVEELRGLVGRVTATAEQVTAASDQAQGTSSSLLAASHQQSKNIRETGQSVVAMAAQITEVSRAAIESADVARLSVVAADEGTLAVGNAIIGMNEIRDQIQETSKRIKRLGESSQEIGEITELISDITEQTNVLALNAAIQAASAGEAGRGFSIVAEEVQRLAERSGEATKQIGALVRTIQTDTHDAVAAMERSTQGVVEGTRLSDAAGAALADIRRVSKRLAELIQGISSATELQASSANGVAENIQHILTVTEKTQEGTQQTAQSIHELSRLAQELKDSVSRFRVRS